MQPSAGLRQVLGEEHPGRADQQLHPPPAQPREDRGAAGHAHGDLARARGEGRGDAAALLAQDEPGCHGERRGEGQGGDQARPDGHERQDQALPRGCGIFPSRGRFQHRQEWVRLANLEAIRDDAAGQRGQAQPRDGAGARRAFRPGEVPASRAGGGGSRREEGGDALGASDPTDPTGGTVQLHARVEGGEHRGRHRIAPEVHERASKDGAHRG
mmetsp:Transcript_11363/g.51440  ORF Transcript_11363/g.51440 Transcript_11363/m.51440 type:complete len:214 (-) Transcript_11363:2513-3154(-)